MDFELLLHQNYTCSTTKFSHLLLQSTDYSPNIPMVGLATNDVSRGSAYDVFLRFLNDIPIHKNISDRCQVVQVSSHSLPAAPSTRYLWVTNDLSALASEKFINAININCREMDLQLDCPVHNFSIQGTRMKGNQDNNIYLDTHIRRSVIPVPPMTQAGQSFSHLLSTLPPDGLLVNMSMHCLADSEFYGKYHTNPLGLSLDELTDILTQVATLPAITLVLSDFYPQVEYHLSVQAIIMLFLIFISK